MLFGPCVAFVAHGRTWQSVPKGRDFGQQERIDRLANKIDADQIDRALWLQRRGRLNFMTYDPSQ